MQQDQFKSSGAQPTPPAGPHRGTGSLGPVGTRPLTPGSVGLPDAQLKEKAAALLEKLEQRVELLIRACQTAGLPLPGVIVPKFRFAVSPGQAPLLEYLVPTFKENPRLAQGVQVAIFRFQEVARAINWRLVGEPDTATDLEALRRKVFFLTNLSAEFKDDQILATIFPPPQTQVATLARLQAAPEDLRRQQAVRLELVKKGYALGAGLAPKMAVVALALETLEKGLTANMKALFTPDGRTAKMIAVALTGDHATIARLKEAYAQYEALKALLPALRDGQGDLAALKPLAIPLGQLSLSFAGQALLRELFTRPAAPPMRAAVGQ